MNGNNNVTPENVLLYLPNIIGYLRIVCTITSFMIMISIVDTAATTSFNYYGWRIAILLYIGSFVGDLFDGMVARAYNQCSIYGSVLDMITDRCSTTGLLYVLSCEYNATTIGNNSVQYRLLFLFLLLLDISSHWCQMYSSIQVSNSNNSIVHHKSDEGNSTKNFLVRWFYKYYWFFGYLCVGAEFTYILLYVQMKLLLEHQQQQNNDDEDVSRPSSVFLLVSLLSSGKISPLDRLIYQFVSLILFICIPGMVAKQVVNIAQLCSSCYTIAQYDAAIKSNNEKGKIK